MILRYKTRLPDGLTIFYLESGREIAFDKPQDFDNYCKRCGVNKIIL